MNENPNLSPADVQKLMGHSQLTTTFIYTHSNEEKNSEAVSIFNNILNNGESLKFNFKQVLSICTGKSYTSIKEINDIIDSLCPNNISEENERYNAVRNIIIKEYSSLKKIDDSGVNLSNVWDWLDMQMKKYGNVFYFNKINYEETFFPEKQVKDLESIEQV